MYGPNLLVLQHMRQNAFRKKMEEEQYGSRSSSGIRGSSSRSRTVVVMQLFVFIVNTKTIL